MASHNAFVEYFDLLTEKDKISVVKTIIEKYEKHIIREDDQLNKPEVKDNNPEVKAEVTPIKATALDRKRKRNSYKNLNILGETFNSIGSVITRFDLPRQSVYNATKGKTNKEIETHITNLINKRIKHQTTTDSDRPLMYKRKDGTLGVTLSRERT